MLYTEAALETAEVDRLALTSLSLQAKERMELERQQIGLSRTPSGEKETVEHKETMV